MSAANWERRIEAAHAQPWTIGDRHPSLDRQYAEKGWKELARTGNSHVETYLTVSTTHSPTATVLDTHPHCNAVEYGWILWAPSLTEEYSSYTAQLADLNYDERLYPIVELAMRMGCAYIRFDRDCDTIDGLPQWEW